MTTHTPGPWMWWTSNSWNRLRHSDRGVSTNVLMPFVCKDGQATIDVSQADMALIAAAPDLLMALKRLTAGNFSSVGHDTGCGCCVCEALFTIAKAEGRP